MQKSDLKVHSLGYNYILLLCGLADGYFLSSWFRETCPDDPLWLAV